MRQYDQKRLSDKWVASEKECYCHKEFDLPDCKLVGDRPEKHKKCINYCTGSINKDFGDTCALEAAKALMESGQVSSVIIERDTATDMWALHFTTFSMCATKLCHYLLFVES